MATQIPPSHPSNIVKSINGIGLSALRWQAIYVPAENLHFEVGGEEFTVNQDLFIRHSRTVAELLRDNPYNRIVIDEEDLSPEVFQIVADFIQGEQVPEEVFRGHLDQLRQAADKFGIDSLKEKCKIFLLAQI